MNRCRGFVFIELLVVIIILAVLAGLYFGVIRKRGEGAAAITTAQTAPGVAIEKAHGIECASNLNQQRQLIQMKAAEDGQFPAAIDNSTISDRCPVSNQPYNYDPQSGQVWCATPGHEDF